jgi:bacterioferritin-associated ferredoxin
MIQDINQITTTGGARRGDPVRVKLRIVNCNHAEPLPPDGVTEGWWQRLKGALGSSSNDFVRASLIQLQSAARLPCSGISELAVNAALALIEAAQPRNELEAALAVQLACTHCAAVAVLARLGGGHGSERRVVALASAAARLLSAYAAQTEALRRLRHGGEQVIRIERVDVHDGGQAVVGAISPR